MWTWPKFSVLATLALGHHFLYMSRQQCLKASFKTIYTKISYKTSFTYRSMVHARVHINQYCDFLSVGGVCMCTLCLQRDFREITVLKLHCENPFLGTTWWYTNHVREGKGLQNIGSYQIILPLYCGPQSLSIYKTYQPLSIHLNLWSSSLMITNAIIHLWISIQR